LRIALFKKCGDREQLRRCHHALAAAAMEAHLKHEGVPSPGIAVWLAARIDQSLQAKPRLKGEFRLEMDQLARLFPTANHRHMS
jgi:NADPH-dependent ferric siderophore reductase